MKKLVLAALAASLVLTFTSCDLFSKDKDDDEDEKDSKTSVSSTADDKDEDSKASDDESKEEESKAEESKAEESKAEESKAEESEPEVSEPDESKDDNSDPANASGTLFTGTGYTLNIDESIWKDASDMNNSVDCAFMYIGDPDNLMAATANFNVVQTSGAFGDMTPKDYAEIVTAQYESMDTYTLKGDSPITVNGMDAHKIEVSVEQSGLVMDMAQIILVDDDKLVCVSYGAEESVFPSLEGEFEKVISTIQLT